MNGYQENRQERGFRSWWQRNKTTILVLLGIAAGATGGYLAAKASPMGMLNTNGILSKESTTLGLYPAFASLPNTSPVIGEVLTTPTVSDRSPVDVTGHLRNLPTGQHASPEKIATAAENGFMLGNGQTWVSDYSKYKSI